MSLEFLYRCEHGETVNNGIKDGCSFEFIFKEGFHHCPLCGFRLNRVSSGPTVSELLRKGQQKVDAEKSMNKKGK